jgi:hypothetical protein
MIANIAWYVERHEKIGATRRKMTANFDMPGIKNEWGRAIFGVPSASIRDLSASYRDMCAIRAATLAILGVEDALTTALRDKPSREDARKGRLTERKMRRQQKAKGARPDLGSPLSHL